MKNDYVLRTSFFFLTHPVDIKLAEGSLCTNLRKLKKKSEQAGVLKLNKFSQWTNLMKSKLKTTTGG